MHIAFNAQLVSTSPSYRDAGVSRYIVNLLGELLNRSTSDRWTLYVPPGVTREMLTGVTDQSPTNLNICSSRLNTSRPILRIFWEQFVSPVVLRMQNPDVLLCPLNVVPLLAPCPVVVVVHDLAFIRLRLHRRLKRQYLAHSTRLSVLKAAHVITVSKFTREEVIHCLGVDPSRVTAIHNGVDARFSPLTSDQVDHFRQREKLPERFLLFVGTLEPRKNLVTLIRAYARVRIQIGMPLIIVGGRGWMFDEIFELVRAEGIERDVQFKGFIRNEDLPAYYAAATAFVYPSLYEGFGFPPLEAMAMGTPVVTSSTTSLPEVVGDAALLVPPLDVGLLADGLLEVTRNDALRSDLRTKGFRQAKTLSWKTSADETMRVMQSVVVEHGGMLGRGHK